MSHNLDSRLSERTPNAKPITILISVSGVILSLAIGFFIVGAASSLQVFALVFGLAAFVFTFARLELGVVAMLLMLYSQAYIIAGERYGVTDIVQGLILLLVFSMAARWMVYTNEVPQRWEQPLFLVAFYCMVALASIVYAVDPDAATPVAVETLKSGTIALIIAVVLKNGKSFHLAIWALLIVGIFLGSLSILQFVTGNYANDYGGFAQASVQNISGDANDYRLAGPVGDPNYYAQMMLTIVPLALDRVWNEKQKLLRGLAALALGASAFTVLLTYSRGGFIAMIVAVIGMVAIFHRGQLRYLLAIGIVTIILANFLPGQFSERISTLTEILPGSSGRTSSVQDYSFRGRTSEMLVAIQMFADHPVLGVGLGNYQVLYQSYSRRLGIDTRSEVRQAHSLYLEVAAETGLLGLFSFILLLWGAFKAMLMSYRLLAQRGLVSISNMVAAYIFGFAGYLAAAIFIHSAYPRNFWLLAGIAFSIPRMAEIEVESAERIKQKTILDRRSVQSS